MYVRENRNLYCDRGASENQRKEEGEGWDGMDDGLTSPVFIQVATHTYGRSCKREVGTFGTRCGPYH